MTISAIEFLRRFLLHVLPYGFTRIRHFGLCAASNVNTKLASARQLLEQDLPDGTLKAAPVTDTRYPDGSTEINDTDARPRTCPSCGKGRLVRRVLLPTRRRRGLATGTDPAMPDTS